MIPPWVARALTALKGKPLPVNVPDATTVAVGAGAGAGALTFNDNTPLQFSDGAYLELAA